MQIDDGELIELSQTEANTPLYTGILNIFFFNQSLVNKFLNIYEFKALENNTRILMLYIAFLNVANISALWIFQNKSCYESNNIFWPQR